MVYKIIGNFTDENLEKILNRIKTKFQFIYVADTLYVALKNIELFDGHEAYLRSTFKPCKEFLITQITEKNIMKLEETIKTWCRDNYVRLEQQKYEIENQEKLQMAWQQLDKIEEELRQKLIEKQSIKTQDVDNAKRKED